MGSLNILALMMILWQHTYAQPHEKFFRNDYTYINSTEGFYKIHTIFRTWTDAKKVCDAEGARLFYPQDVNEANVATEFLKKSQSFSWVFVGASAILAQGIYETIDGVSVNKLYNKWAPGEPNNGNVADCVVLQSDGTLDDVNCASKYPFICKKTLASLQWNEQCNVPDLAYELNKESGRCYKIHLDAKNWIDAFAICSAEQSYLTVINSQAEADYLLNLTSRSHPETAIGNFVRGVVLVGIHDRTNEGWVTIKGVPLVDSGYSVWGAGEPNNASVIGEQCGSIYFGGGLNDIACDAKSLFICEHEVEAPVTKKLDEQVDSMNKVNTVDGEHVP